MQKIISFLLNIAKVVPVNYNKINIDASEDPELLFVIKMTL